MKYDKEEINEAQDALNRYTDASKFWDTQEGQDVLKCARAHGLRSQSTNQARSRVQAEAMAMERQGWND